MIASYEGSEAMKALVLGGVGQFTVVDGDKCTPSDLGENYAITEENVRSCASRASAVTQSLLTLNDNVSGSFVEDNLPNILSTRQEFFQDFTLVIATQLRDCEAKTLDTICRDFNVKVVFVRSYGMVGFIRASVKEHCIVESKPDHLPDDLRLSDPWPELLAYAASFQLESVCGTTSTGPASVTMDDMTFKHIPYVVILLHCLDMWKRTHSGSHPSSSSDLKEFKACIKQMSRTGDEENIKEAVGASHKVLVSKTSTVSSIPKEVNAVLNDPSAMSLNAATSTDFWIIVSAVREFVYGSSNSENENIETTTKGTGHLPLEGSLPDMTSFTEYYLSLQEIYQNKAMTDAKEVHTIVKRKLGEIGRESDSISINDVKHICKHARCLNVIRHVSLIDEMEASEQKGGKIQLLLEDESTSSCTLFYLLLRAVDRAYNSLNRYPGEFDQELEDDICSVRMAAMSILSEYGLTQSLNLSLTLLDDYVKEVCRYGGAELHVISAIMGGIAAQESLKLILAQYTPIFCTYVFDAVHMLGTSIDLT